jgi:hypothetical protein
MSQRLTNALKVLKYVFHLLVFATLFGSAAQSYADEWVVLGGTWRRTDIPDAPTEYGSGLGHFTDHEYPPFVWTSYRDTTHAFGNAGRTESFIFYGAGSPEFSFMQAPIVDLDHMRANFSSLWWLAWAGPEQQPEPGISLLGLNVGAHDWIPIVANGDGSFTARWNAPPSVYSFLPSRDRMQISMTFVSAVPEPSTLLLTLVALPLVLLVARQKRKMR